MIKIRMLLAFSILTFWVGSATAIDSLYVLQIGDGAAALTSASTAVIVKSFDASTGSAVGSPIPLPTAVSGANKPLTVVGTSGSEGHMALSANGQYLTMMGYGTAPGLALVGNTESTTVNRVIGRITISGGAVDTTTALTDAYTGFSGTPPAAAGVRSVVTSNGTDFWMAGTRGFGAPSGSDGVRYATLGATTSTSIMDFPNGPSNTRVVGINNGQLYMSTGSASGTAPYGFIGVHTIGTGLPTTSGQTAPPFVNTSVSGAGTVSPYDFWIKDALTVYVADDRTLANGGGIQKWLGTPGGTSAGDYNGNYVVDAGDEVIWKKQNGQTGAGLAADGDGSGTVDTADFDYWRARFGNSAVTFATSPDYTISAGPNGARGLTGVVSGSDTILYATTGEAAPNSKLIKVIDAGGASAFTTLATAPANTVFRGIAFVPGGAGSGSGLAETTVPEPASAVLLMIGLAAFCSRRRRA